MRCQSPEGGCVPQANGRVQLIPLCTQVPEARAFYGFQIAIENIHSGAPPVQRGAMRRA